MSRRVRVLIPFEAQAGRFGSLSMTLQQEEKGDDCLTVVCRVRRGISRYVGLLVLDIRQTEGGWAEFCAALSKVVAGKRKRAVFHANEGDTIEVLFTEDCYWLAMNAHCRWHSNAVFPRHLAATAQKHRFSPGRPSGWALEAVLVNEHHVLRLKGFCLSVLERFNRTAESHQSRQRVLRDEETRKLKAATKRWQAERTAKNRPEQG